MGIVRLDCLKVGIMLGWRTFLAFFFWCILPLRSAQSQQEYSSEPVTSNQLCGDLSGFASGLDWVHASLPIVVQGAHLSKEAIIFNLQVGCFEISY